MTNEEARNMLVAKKICLTRETSGTDKECNSHNCENCGLNYDQGNMGEQKEALEMAIKALEQQPCEDCISRQAVLDIWHTRYSNNREENDEIQFKKIAFELPSVTPSHEDLKEAYIKGYDYGVKDWFKAKTENALDHLTDRPCEVCEFHKDGSCSKWSCVFEE